MRLGYRREFLHELKQLLPPWNFVPFIFFCSFLYSSFILCTLFTDEELGSVYQFHGQLR